MSCLLHTAHTVVGHPVAAVRGTLCTNQDCPQHALCLEELEDESLCGQAWDRLEAKKTTGRGDRYERWLVCSDGHQKTVEDLGAEE